MSLSLRIFLIAGVLIYLIFIFVMLRKKRLNLKYSLLWIFTAIVFLVTAVFPTIAESISKLLGISTTINAVYLIFGCFTLILLIFLTAVVSMQHRKIKILIQQTALLEKKIDDIQKP